MNGAVEILKRERDEAVDEIRTLRLRIRDVEAAINILEGQPAPHKSGRGTGDLKQIVFLKLCEFGENGGTPKEIAEALTNQGRPTSDASVSSTLSRLKFDQRVTNRAGQWFAAKTAAPEQLKQETVSNVNSEWEHLDEETPF